MNIIIGSSSLIGITKGAILSDSKIQAT